MRNKLAGNQAIRVTSGKFRGISLNSPQSSHTHPMGAREKLALFNMVNVENAVVLDAFAGSGALGIEALSRGAKEVVFVESQAKVAQTIRENLKNIEGAGTGDLNNAQEVSVFVKKMSDFADLSQFCHYFDVILADPPYDKMDLDEIRKLPQLLKSGGILALSSPANEPEIELEGLRISSSHTYARAKITIYRG